MTHDPLSCTFANVAQEASKRHFEKSYAQVARSDAPLVSPKGAPPATAGLRPRPPSPKWRRSYGLKLKEGELEVLRERAKALNLSVNAYIRVKALDDAYIERPSSWLRDVLLKLYVELARQGNNLNQLAHRVNREALSAEEALSVAESHRAPVFRLLENIELALAGRRPPDDY